MQKFRIVLWKEQGIPCQHRLFVRHMCWLVCCAVLCSGSEQSRKAEDIRREMLSLGEAGYKEVTLLGQNVDAYGRDLPGMAADASGRREWTFTDLLR